MATVADGQLPAGEAPPPEQHPGQELQAPSPASTQAAPQLGAGEWRDRSDLPDAPYGLLHSLVAHGGKAVTAVQFDAAGHRVASAGADGTAAIWDPRTGQLLHRLTGHKGGISDVAWSPDGRYLATAGDDHTVRVWDTASGACCRILQAHSHHVMCCAWSAGGNLLASGGFDEVVVVWDVRQGKPVRIIPGHADPVSGVAFGGEPGSELIASCSFDGLTRGWQLPTGQCATSLVDRHNNSPALASLRFTPNGKFLLTVTMDSRLMLWEPISHKIKKTYKGHLNHSTCLQACFVVHDCLHDPPQKFVACGSEDRHVYLWDLNTKQIMGILRGRPSADAPGSGHCATVLAVDAAQQVGCMLIASGGHTGDGTLKIWQHEQMPEAAAAEAPVNEAAADGGAAAAAAAAAPPPAAPPAAPVDGAAPMDDS